MASKAILDLIPVLNIRRMVLGTTKSNLRYVNGKRLLLGRTYPSRPNKEKCNDLEEILSIRRLRSKKGSEITEILQKTPETCEIKIICEGKEVVLDETIVESPTTVTRGSEDGSKSTQQQQQEENQCGNYFSCVCFKPKTLNWSGQIKFCFPIRTSNFLLRYRSCHFDSFCTNFLCMPWDDACTCYHYVKIIKFSPREKHNRWGFWGCISLVKKYPFSFDIVFRLYLHEVVSVLWYFLWKELFLYLSGQSPERPQNCFSCFLLNKIQLC